MKYLLIFFLIALQFQSYSQLTKIDSFMDIRWGSSISSVIKTMSKKENVKLQSKTDTLIIMSGGDFGGREVLTWQFYFWKDEFYSAILFLEVSTPIYLDDLFYGLRKDISNKYGEPYIYDSTSYESRTIFWEYDKKDKKSDDCFISLTINSDPFFWLVLCYQNNSIFGEKTEYEKKKREKTLEEL